MTVKGAVIRASEVQVGDHIVLPGRLGPREVLEVNESTFGLDETPCIRIIYAANGSLAFENRAGSAKGARSVSQPTAGLRPLLHDERVAIERRA